MKLVISNADRITELQKAVNNRNLAVEIISTLETIPKNLKSDKARELIQDALLDSRKMERLLRIEQDINNPELTKKGLANSYVKFKSLLGQYGAELSFNDYKTAWEEMEAQDRFDLSVEDFNNLIKELEGDLK